MRSGAAAVNRVRLVAAWGTRRGQSQSRGWNASIGGSTYSWSAHNWTPKAPWLTGFAPYRVDPLASWREHRVHVHGALAVDVGRNVERELHEHALRFRLDPRRVSLEGDLVPALVRALAGGDRRVDERDELAAGIDTVR
jgi:hypothetical protein